MSTKQASNAADLPSVSVIMPIRNEAEHIERCLDAVLAQDYPADRLDVVVVDGMSDDGTREIVGSYAQRYPRIRLLDNPQRIVPTALNIGIRAAQGEIILRIDGHTTIAPDYVRQCAVALERTGADNVGGRMDAQAPGYFGKAVALATSSPFGVGNARFHYSHKEEWVDTVYMGAYRREIFDRIGLFDEEMVRDQDDEFNYRLRAHGGRILLCPQIRSRYTNRSCPRKLWRQYFEYGYWKVRVLQKHPRQMRWRQFVPPLFVLALAGTLGLSALAVFWPLVLIAGCYLVANLAASLWIAQQCGLRYLAALPMAFAILHISYGMGFLKGLVRFANRWGERRSSDVDSADEIRRIRGEYARRAHDADLDALYSLFNPGALFLQTQRARCVLSTLRRQGISCLSERTILEVGCGGGGVLQELLAYGADSSRLHGIDLLEWRLHRACHTNSSLLLACGEVQHLPYADSSFDLVLQFTVFTSVLSSEMKGTMAREMLRVLRPDGLILWYDFWLDPTNAQTRGILPAEINALFPDCGFEFRRITLAPPIARRLAGWAWGACLLLEWLRLFNTHYLVAIQPQSGKTGRMTRARDKML